AVCRTRRCCMQYAAENHANHAGREAEDDAPYHSAHDREVKISRRMPKHQDECPKDATKESGEIATPGEVAAFRAGAGFWVGHRGSLITEGNISQSSTRCRSSKWATKPTKPESKVRQI